MKVEEYGAVADEEPALGPHEVRIREAFIFLKGEPIQLGRDVGGDISFCFVSRPYTPRLFRRPRLKRFASTASRVAATRLFWREGAK